MKKILFSLIIFIAFCLMGLVVGVVGYQDVNPTSLLIYHDNVPVSSGLILPGRSVHSEFVATENNLAILRIRLRTYNRMNTTHFVFRLREKGMMNWSVTNTYVLDRVPDGLLYPFGFSPITDSKGKTYEFELLSSDSTPDNAIGVSGGYHGIAAQYVQPLSQFYPEKIISTIRDPYSDLYFGMFMIPALIFLFKRFRLLLFGCLLVLYTYLPVSVHSNIVLFIAVTELFVGNAFLIGILLLLQIPVTIAFGNILAANRLATLVFFSLLSGVIMAIKELKKD
jgi:hypothetical protein